jgi:hypothetical protein
MDERTFSKSAIRERRLALQRQLALQQRQLEALAKLDDAADELERVEREIEALSRGETQAEPEQPVEAVPGEPQPGEPETVSSGPQPAAPEQPVQAIPSEPESAEGGTAEPQTTGPQALEVLKGSANAWLEVRDVLAGMQERGWIDTDTGRALSRLRHSLRRLVHSNPHVERDETDTTFRYRYVTPADSYALTPVPHANGTAYPALQGRLTDNQGRLTDN